MPETSTIRRARKAKRQGKAPSTQAGEFVREEIHHVREGKHGARSPEQAIAIGLSKARRSGVDVGEPRTGRPSRKKTNKKASSAGSRQTASRAALASHARTAAKRRSPADRSRAAKKAARTRARRQSSSSRATRHTS